MTSTTPVPGRKRDASRDDALRQAALEVLAEVGYDRLTVDAVAARAGAGKATCYRRWASKAELVVDAVSHIKAKLEQPNTGSLRGDLIALTSHATARDDSFRVDVQSGLLTGLVRDAQLREVFAEQFVAPRKAVFRTIFEQAVERGEITPAPNVELLSDIVPSMVFHQLLTTGRPPTPEFVLRVIDEIVLPLAQATPEAKNQQQNQNQTRTPSS
ncbi:TetR/AcrR family transcriptional regulator [Streptacidiphilus jiangxiensis]|uniref:DNA-binding transcriptional regulator, AcrR family n=1 Tax=Streptacidiphilus jiangxiensis TaxID=235985 RepID=A0A1H7V1F7_STRJI|nr:TetR/AcrR family transcriptional regulator [Streptacidiphilus jiangxiensis]SEM03000.1 DNA-binding transcriptional regulator, AcrR family [Streptacidiphilus jiangxiensis]